LGEKARKIWPRKGTKEERISGYQEITVQDIRIPDYQEIRGLVD
jgi:hypothetical protein